MQINMRRKLCVSKNTGGQTVTSETALQLPLTYYGPSISSGSDGAWTPRSQCTYRTAYSQTRGRVHS
ncbi:hypothetical protein BDR07DRAFT_1431629 [Suillus spraguei]|nr:hypothetical protein BDR07DRAFT_1431629 [Suillus spraguei]